MNKIEVIKVDSWYVIRVEHSSDMVEYLWAGYDEVEAHAKAQRL